MAKPIKCVTIKQPRKWFKKTNLSWSFALTRATNGQEEDHKDHNNIGDPKEDGRWNGATLGEMRSVRLPW